MSVSRAFEMRKIWNPPLFPFLSFFSDIGPTVWIVCQPVSIHNSDDFTITFAQCSLLFPLPTALGKFLKITWLIYVKLKI